MIPIRDQNPTGHLPFINYSLIAINILIFLYMTLLPRPFLDSFMRHYALIPAVIIGGQSLHTLLTSMFLHGSLGHLFGNMLFLNIFGDNMEDYLGHIKYLFFYLLCGLAAGLLQIFTNPFTIIPNLGASGAIAGIMGGYLVLFPKKRVDILAPWLFTTLSVPAYMMLFYWILAQFFLGFGTIGTVGNSGGVAYFAHIGGFLTGLLSILFTNPPGKRKSSIAGT